MNKTRLMAQGHQYMASGGHPLATQTSLSILEAGGNAVDAAIAGAMVLGVVQSDLVNFAGVAPIMVRLPQTQQVVTVSGVGRWPMATDINRFIEEFEGHVPEGISRSIIPGAPDAFLTALEHFGTMSFKEVATGAINAAEKGFIMHELMAQTIKENEAKYKKWPSNQEIYLPNGRPPEVGDLFIQSNLARALKYMTDQESSARGSRDEKIDAARKAFYKGDIASAISHFHNKNGGWITQEDLANFRVTLEPPIEVTRYGTKLFTCGSWCQGVSLAEMWSLLRNTKLADLGHNSADYIHIVTEVIKVALADREHYVGDPDFVDVPLKKLLSGKYAKDRLSLIQKNSTLPNSSLWGDESSSDKSDSFSQDTSYMCAVDKNGLVASITPSDGSANTPVLPGWGINPSSRGSQSWAVRDHPSSVAPWKRPRLTPNPAIVVFEDGGVMPFGTPGADVQTQAMLQVLLNIVDFNRPLQEAVELPRFASYDAPDSFEPHSYQRKLIKIEKGVEPDVKKTLTDYGHKVEDWPSYTWKAGAVCAILDQASPRLLSGAADPRRPCLALGV